MEEDFYKKAVIKFPEDYVDEETKYTRVVVDSRVRNKTLFPNPNSYEIPFEDDINDVKTAKLVYMDIPMSLYLINANFNTIYFNINSNSYIATIPNGNYSPTELATEIQVQMRTVATSLSIATTFTVTYNTRLDNFTFESDRLAFSLLFAGKPKNLASLLGFSDSKAEYTSDTNREITSEFRKNFNYNNYIIMDIEQFDMLKSIDRDLNKSFAMIPEKCTNLNIIGELNIVKHFSPSIPRLTKLRIRLYDRFGNPYDCQNMDHRFEIVFTSFKQKRKYMH
jgi:hypothetical protein